MNDLFPGVAPAQPARQHQPIVAPTMMPPPKGPAMPLTRRSCPHCGARGIIGAWWAPFGWPMRWNCPSCSQPLKFSGRRALVLALLRVPLNAVFVYAIFAHMWWVAAGAAVLAIASGGMEMVDGAAPARTHST